MDKRIIKIIEFPNTVENPSMFTVGKSCDEIKIIRKAGGMSGITWFQVIKNNKTMAEIKKSVCNIYFK